MKRRAKVTFWGLLIFLAVVVGISNGVSPRQTEAATGTLPHSSGDKVTTRLVTDADVHLNIAGDYYTSYWAARPARRGNTTVSFILDIGTCRDDADWCDMTKAHMVQAGLMTTKSKDIHWFVSIEVPSEGEIPMEIECLRGSHQGLEFQDDDYVISRVIEGCVGESGDIVDMRQWHGFQITREGDTWIVRVHGERGIPHKVATIKTERDYVWDVRSDYSENPDKEGDSRVAGGFWHGMPHYRFDGAWQKWPATEPGSTGSFARNTATVEGDCRRSGMTIEDRINENGGMWFTGDRAVWRGAVCVIDPLW